MARSYIKKSFRLSFRRRPEFSASIHNAFGVVPRCGVFMYDWIPACAGMVGDFCL
jgi:hypothetical protein